MPLTDPSQLFQTRIDALKEMRGDLDEEGKALVDAAVSETLAASDAFLSLAQFAKRVSQSLKNRQQESSAKLQESLEQLKQMRLNAAMVLANPRATQQQKKDVVAFLDAATQSTKDLARIQGATQQLVVETFVTVTTLLVNLLSERILRPNYHEFDVKAVQDFIEYALDIVAVLGTKEAIAAATIKVILKSFVFDRLHPTDGRKVYLENYIASVKAWIQAVNAIIEAFDSADAESQQ